MLEDGVDFAEEPVYAGRERSSVAKRIASVGSRVLGAVRRTLSSPSSPAPVVAVPVPVEEAATHQRTARARRRRGPHLARMRLLNYARGRIRAIRPRPRGRNRAF